MKKNISINISGIIFHIEEDGYETLKKYLDSINKYFSSFEDSSEILADIESRIAEILLSKLNEGKQVITLEDITALTTTMGSVSDFKAAEEREIPKENATSSAGKEYSNKSEKGFLYSKKLLRDKKRKIFGGVCAGIGSYLEIDALWIRLLFVLLFGATSGIFVIVYIVLWIVVPGSFDLEEPQTAKKMFRNPEQKVIGGVASGIAAFFGIDIVAVRVLFVVFIFFGGLGFFTYVILWIILPEARTITERVQMEGEPVTLSNIESTIKKNLNERETGEETTLTKIILAPFRLIAVLITALSKILTPVVHIFRVLIGLLLVLIGIALIFSTVFTTGVLLGFFTFHAPWVSPEDLKFPIEAFKQLIPNWTVMGAFAVILIPSLLILLLGTSVIAQRFTFGAVTGWTLFVLFFVGIALLGASVPGIVYSFRKKGEYKVENSYALAGKTAVLKVNGRDIDGYPHFATNLELRGHDRKEIKLVETFKARGGSESDAIENAHMINYNVAVRDSVFIFDSAVGFKEHAVFHAQQLSMVLYIPYDQPFVMERGVSRLIRHYIEPKHRHGYTWSMTKDGIKCLTCEDKREYSWGLEADDRWEREHEWDNDDWDDDGWDD